MSKNYRLGCVKCAGSTPTPDTAETCSNRAVDEFLLTLGSSLNKSGMNIPHGRNRKVRHFG